MTSSPESTESKVSAEADEAIHTAEALESPVVPFPLGRSSVTLGALVVLLAAVCLAVLQRLGWTDHYRYVLIAASVCGGSAILSMVPVWILSRKSIQGAAQGFLAGILVRMAICGAAVVILGRVVPAEKTMSSLWIGGWYMVVLMCELLLVGRYIKLSSGAKVGKTSDSVKSEHLEDESHS